MSQRVMPRPEVGTVTFLLPSGGSTPCGGFKVVYEYANGLSESGWRVRVAHPHRLGRNEPVGFPRRLTHAAVDWRDFYRRRSAGWYRPDAWFKTGPQVDLLYTRNLGFRYMPPSDVWIATAWQTAEWVAEYPHSLGVKLWLVQDYEHYMASSDSVRRRMSSILSDRKFIKVGYASVVAWMLEKCGSRMDAQVSIGIDHDVYNLSQPIESQQRNAIGFPLRREPVKGLETAVKALAIVQRKYPSVRVWAFGNGPPGDLPAFIDYYKSPSDENLSGLYNQTSIFVVASDYEGWGLPGSEAMACGAALASTDTGGVREYAEDGRTALLSRPRDPEALAANIERLIEDRELRVRLARNGHRHIQQFTWTRAVAGFDRVLRNALKHP